ncbi:MAG: ASKHA domain-containing protein [bacterium]|nr:ASKHA domain-containing protein [bacterium]
MPKITFYPDNKELDVAEGVSLTEAAISSGIFINSACGKKGLCGKCKVRVKDGKVETKPTGILTQEEIEKGFVLSCQSFPRTDVIVDLPPSARTGREQILKEEAKIEHLEGVLSKVKEIERLKSPSFPHSPLATKLFLKLLPPTLDDHISDLERLSRELASDIKIDLCTLREIPGLLRQSDWGVTAIMSKEKILYLEEGDTSHRNFGLACDVGTTSVVVQLIDLSTEKILDTEASYNRQLHYGADVITRIIFAKNKEGLERLNSLIIKTINCLIQRLSKEHKIDPSEITAMVCAGNTTMLSLLLKISPAYIRLEPYIPAFSFSPKIKASEIGININSKGALACLPNVASYVGGDIVSGVLASRIYEADELSMLIDIGTNGEIAIGNKDWLVCCASSAGPAFEGGGVRCGIRAMDGAISSIEIAGDYKVRYSTIGNASPIGICGSGLIDSLTELLKVEIIDRAGNIREEVPTERIRRTGDGLEFVLVRKEESALSEDIVITQSDISNLIFSKGAIYTAASVLANKMGFQLQDIKRLYIAGGFGNYLSLEKAIMIGLLPDIERSKLQFIGNSSLVGARLCLCSQEAMDKAKEIAKRMTYIELSANSDYMHEYTASLFLPHTDIDRFPTVNRKL